MSYLCPIETFVDAMDSSFEDGTLKIVRKIGFNVDTEELKKALLYDRRQYEKGYLDGKAESINYILGAIDRLDGSICTSDERMKTAKEHVLNLMRQDVLILKGGTTRDCKTCGHSIGGKRVDTEECHDCMWESNYIKGEKG